MANKKGRGGNSGNMNAQMRAQMKKMQSEERGEPAGMMGKQGKKATMRVKKPGKPC